MPPTSTPCSAAASDPGALSRRHFLMGAGALGVTAALGPVRAQALTDGVATAPGSAAPGPLVVITLYGGNDALNTVVPMADPNYLALRSALAIDPGPGFDIGEGFGLHPSLERMKSLWDDGRLAVVHGVGFADLDRSHFHCMDVWQSGSEDDMSSGWVGRWLDRVGTDPLDAVGVGDALPLLLRGERRSAAMVPTGPFALPGGAHLADHLTTLSTPLDGRPPLEAMVAQSTHDLLNVIDRVSPLREGSTPVIGDGRGGELAAHLDTVAALIEGGLPTRMYGVDLRGFDTHADQATTHATLLGQLDAALGAFFDRVAGRPVTVAVYSEFGRRVVPNASGGTDHGRGGTMFLAGAVQPGHHGEPPPLDGLENGDLAVTTDFRSVFGGLLEGVLQISSADVFDDAPAPLTLV